MGKELPYILQFYDNEVSLLISNKYGYSITSIKHNLYNQPNKIKEHIFIFKDEYLFIFYS